MSEQAEPVKPSVPAFDPLLAFAAWFMRQPGLSVPQCPFDGVTRVGAFSGLVLYRKAPYQVQMWICDPNTEAPDHSHPNVDSLQQYLSGEMSFRLNGKEVMALSDVKDDGSGYSTARGATLRVRPTDSHGATIGPKGACFLTFQHFLDGNPRSVEVDWVGEPLSADHAIAIKHR
jgi:hypothetical protein